ncbi:carboxypeptidase B-like [Centruroides vittatus]|uniref:carboxypeptidase B-like n=1 Tax=Centruroides vittatus TaxID=120091 RepID=UPI00350EB34A
MKFLTRLSNNSDYDFWLGPHINSATDIMVSESKRKYLEDNLKYYQIPYKTMIEDVQKIFEAERRDAEELTGRVSPTFFDKYQTLNEIYRFMESLADEFPDIASVFTIGTSYEVREMKGIKIGSNKNSSKPIIWLDAGIHAREWISPPTVLYIATQLATEYEIKDDVKKLVDEFDWYILPVANPDGYVYSHTTNRLWRKTRSMTRSFWGCRGADPNRNFGYQWNVAGASNEPCSEIFAGYHPFSEPETKNIADFLTARKDNLKLYLTYHSYGQFWFTPWGYTKTLPSSYHEMINLAQPAIDAIEKKHGFRYSLGSSSNLLYLAAGGSDDWAYGSLGVKYSYTIELRDTGTYGFALPQRFIIPVGEENWEAVKTLAMLLKDKLR